MEEEKGVLELFAPTRINGSEDSTGERHIADLQRVFRRFEEGSRALTRARGLKLVDPYTQLLPILSRPHTGAWIETATIARKNWENFVAPSHGRVD